MAVVLIRFLGWLLVTLPEAVPRMLCRVVGDLVFYLHRERRRTTLSNLHHAFPDRDPQWRYTIGRRSCRRMIELFLLVLARPAMDRQRALGLLTVTGEAQEQVDQDLLSGSGGVALVPHTTMGESLQLVPSLLGSDRVRFGAIYRPMDHPGVDRWVKQSREQYGTDLISRRGGFSKAMAYVRDGGWTGILFDQNAGDAGSLITCFDRVASATDLPGKFVQRLGCPAIIACARRTGFWKSELILHPLRCEPDSAAVTLAANAWMEDYLRSGDEASADWLWAHARWKILDRPHLRLRIEHRRSFLDADCAFHGRSALPRRTRFWIRLPEDPATVNAVVDLLPALRESRPDGAFTLICPEALITRIREAAQAASIRALPTGTRKTRRATWGSWREEYPDTFLSLAMGPRASEEARWLDAWQRFTWSTPHGKTPGGFTHSAPRPPESTGRGPAVADFFRHFGARLPENSGPESAVHGS